MKKLFILFVILAFVFVGCSQPTSDTTDYSEPTVTTPTVPEEPSVPETPTTTEPTPTTDEPTTTTPPTTVTPEEPNVPETPDTTDNGDEETPSDNGSNSTTEEPTTTELDNGEETPSTENVNEEEEETPIVVVPNPTVVLDSRNSVDKDEVLSVSWENENSDIYDYILYTLDNSNPVVSNIYCHSTTSSYGINLAYADSTSILSPNSFSFTVRAVPAKNVNGTWVYGEEVSKTYAINTYTVSYHSSKELRPQDTWESKTIRGGDSMTIGSGFSAPIEEGYWFDYWSVDGVKMNKGDRFVVRKDTLIEANFKSWTYPYSPKDTIPENYENITCSSEYDRVSNYWIYHCTVETSNYNFIVNIKDTSISKFTSSGVSYVKWNGTVLMYSKNGTQLARKDYSYDSKTGNLVIKKTSSVSITIPVKTNVNWLVFGYDSTTIRGVENIFYCNPNDFETVDLR